MTPMEGRGLMRGAALLCALSIIRLVFSGHPASPILPEGTPDALPELLTASEEIRRRDSIRSIPLAPGELLDPNRSGVEELDRLPGVGPQVARAIVHHRTTEGGFSQIEDLLRVPGIGPALSRRIVESRSKEGPFKAPDDLLRVPGIGPVTLSKLKPLIRVGMIS